MSTYLNREVLKEIVFNESTDGKDRFCNFYAVQAWLKENGYSLGQMCHPQPMAIMIGKYDWIAKWKNLTKKEISQIDGCVVGNTDNGYKVMLFKINEAVKTAA